MHFTRTATFAIAIVTAVAWLLTEGAGLGDDAALAFGLVPARLSGLIDFAPAVPAWLTPLSSTLVHGGFLHVALNLLMLVWCGALVERVLGSSALVLLYLVGAYAAALAQWAVDPASMVPVIGASGAISAVIGAFALSFSQPRQIVRSAGFNRLLNGLWLLAAWIAVQLLIGLTAGMQGFLLAIPAHIGGFLAGLALQRPLLLWRYRGA
jgi:membrane associated rhomboid family serine protease